MKSLQLYIKEDVFDLDKSIAIENYPLYDNVIIEKIDNDVAYVKVVRGDIKLSENQLVHYFAFRNRFGINKFIFNKKLRITLYEKDIDFEGLYFQTAHKESLFIDIKTSTCIKNLKLKSKDIFFTLDNKEHWDNSMDNKNYQLIFDNVELECESIRNSFGVLPTFVNCKYKNKSYWDATIVIEGGIKLEKSLTKIISEKNSSYSILDFNGLDNKIKRCFSILIKIKNQHNQYRYYSFYYKKNRRFSGVHWGYEKDIDDWKIVYWTVSGDGDTFMKY